MIIVAVVVCLFIVVEARRLGMPHWAWLLVPLTFAVAVAFTFPAFLAWRQVHLHRDQEPSSPAYSAAPAEVGR